MPTIERYSGYRFYFYSHEPNEPPHVHVDKGGATAKIWIDPPALARNLGYKPKELAIILEFVRENQKNLLDSWYGYFGT